MHRFLDDRYANTAQAIAHSPLTVDSYVLLRFQIFFDEFLKPYLSINDYWYRVEWQHRGSLHIHGLAWMENVPDSNVCAENDVVRFWNMYVNSWNPAIHVGHNPVDFYWPVQGHPCSIPYEEIVDLPGDLKDLVNVCQKHTRCSPGYCLRVLPDGQQRCRFGFPKPIQPYTTAVFTLDENGHRTKLEIVPASNDPSINRYNSRCLSVWRANMDMNVTFDMTDVSKYIAKYASKGEKATTDFAAILNTIVNHDVRPDAGLGQIAGRLLTKTVGSIDVSAQQAVHIMTSLPLIKCSRHIANLTVDGTGIQDNLNGAGSSEVRKYMARPAAQEHLSLLQITKLFTSRQRPDGTVLLTQRRGGEAVVVVMPRYNRDPGNPDFTKYCMQFLLLHKPFRDWNELCQGFPDAVAAYHALMNIIHT